jgi:predicted GNAT family acetyltransferase
MSDIAVHDNPSHRRFELTIDGELGGRADYRFRDGIAIIVHSEIDPRHRGQGLGSELAARTLDELRARGVQVIPSCPFFAEFVAEHPEYQDMVAD